MKITLLRTNYTKTTTAGIMLLDDKFFGYTLEDAVRFTPKEPAKTAIAASVYRVVVDYSNRFRRPMPRLLNVPNFEGIRIHGGNTHENTEGCILVARNRINDETIQGTLERDLTAKIKDEPENWIEIINTLDIG